MGPATIFVPCAQLGQITCSLFYLGQAAPRALKILGGRSAQLWPPLVRQQLFFEFETLCVVALHLAREQMQPESRCSNGNSSRMSRSHCARLGLWLLGVSRAMAGAATSCGRKQCMFFLFLRYEHVACGRSSIHP